jgi:hypothetical protein
VARTPNLFIVGAPKSGTTSLYEYLKGHPQVFMSPVKEPNYFAPDLADPRDNMLRHGQDEQRYLDLFADVRDELYAGEGSVRYLYSRAAPALIRSVQAEPRIVVMLRDPVEMAYSLYRHMTASGHEDAPTFESALTAEAGRRDGRGIPPGMNPHLATYRDRARYGEQLPRWFETFGRELIHVIIFEEFAARPDLEFSRLLDFLGIDASYQPAEFRAYNAAHAARNLSMRRLLNTSPAQWLVWKAAPRLIGDTRTRRLVQTFRRSRLHRSPATQSKVAPDLRAQLEVEFAPDVASLSALLGRDLSSVWFGRAAGAPLPAMSVGAS